MDLISETSDTQNYITFANAPTSSQDIKTNPDFVFDASNTRLGIGTDIPAAKLELFSRADETVLLRFNTDRAWNFRQEGTGANTRLELNAESGGKWFDITNENRYKTASFYTNYTSSQINLCPDGGNVGIGTVTPGALLDVQHHAGSGAQGIIRNKATQANASSFIQAADSGITYIGLLKYGTGHAAYGALGAGDGALYANSGDGNDTNITIMADSSTGYINFATGGNTERLRITSDGNVGIGTDDPTSLLHMSGSAPRITLTDTAGTDDYAKIFSTGGSLYLQQRDTNSHGSIIFRTEDNSGAVERLSIDSSGNTKITGQLEVTTGANSFLTSANVFKGTAGQKGVYLRSALSAEGTPSYSSVDDTDTGIFLPGSDVFAVTTGGAERLRIDSLGRVGLCSVSVTPGDYWDEADDVVIKTGSDTGITIVSGVTDHGTISFADGTSGDARYRGYIQYTQSSEVMKFGTSAAEAMRIDSDGNVGIGTIDPTHVNATTNNSAVLAVGILTARDATFDGNVFIDGTLSYENVTDIESLGIITARSNIDLEDWIRHYGHIDTKFGFPDEDVFAVETAGSEALRIDSGGRVGLGSDPQNYGDAAYYDDIVINNINGDGGNSTGGAGITLLSNPANWGALIFGDTLTSSQKGYIKYDHTNDKMCFGTNGGNGNASDDLVIDSSGRTIIGHTASLSEGCLLQVARANDNTVELFGYSANANGARINSVSYTHLTLPTKA